MIRDDEAIWLLGMLEAISAKRRIAIRYESLADNDGETTVKSGLVRLRGAPVVIVERRLSARQKCEVLLDALRHEDLSDVFVPPLVRRLIEE